MVEQWIQSRLALRITNDQRALCSRLKEGLIEARASLLIIGDRKEEGRLIPQGFWWAGDSVSLEQDWETGEFSTWIDEQLHCRAFGVRLALSQVLELVEFEKRALISRELSVAGNYAWMTAKEAQAYAFTTLNHNPGLAGPVILEQARLGFVTARAVQAQATVGSDFEEDWAWQEREWDIPTWFWTGFTESSASSQDWNRGKFSGLGRGPKGIRSVTLTGVYFLRESIEAMASPKASKPISDKSNAGRKPTYDWAAVTNEIWAKLYGNELKPNSQADLERAMIALLAVGDKEPSPSTVRPFASAIWGKFSET